MPLSHDLNDEDGFYRIRATQLLVLHSPTLPSRMRKRETWDEHARSQIDTAQEPFAVLWDRGGALAECDICVAMAHDDHD